MSASDDKVLLSGVSAIKLALLAQQARSQSQALLSADPVAVIGMGCRLPGGVRNPEDFWKLLANRVDAVSDVPHGRWDVDALYDPDPSVPGKMATKRGGFIGDISGFDATYFGILRREAERMDPQQRLLLEVAIEALDHAGLPRQKLAGSRTGMFVASYYNDYAQLQYGDPESIDSRTLTGTLHSVLASRLSFLLDLRGPNVSVDTACSSSLVAIHLACQSLRSGESDLAIAGGVSLMITPDMMISLSKVGFMAPDGRCKTFDASADGFGRGEGCGVVVLKRLADAIADGDRILALVRGSAVNQDGRSTVLAAPNGLAQQELIREALRNAQVDGRRVGFVETHGTGTALGDPIEVEALGATIGVPAPGAPTCLLGAAKSNVGHLEAAAGITGFIKTVLVLQKEQVPPQAHFDSLNPHISLAGTRLAIPTELTPWPRGPVPRCAGTSSFGVGGTNAHVVLEEAPALPRESAPDRALADRLLPISAQSPSALRDMVQRWVEFLQDDDVDFAAACQAAGQRRSHLDYRVAAVAADRATMLVRLREYLAGAPSTGIAAGHRASGTSSRLAFVFSGQGQQWAGMGRELLDAEPVFRDALQQVAAAFRRHGDFDLLEHLARPHGQSQLDDTAVAQPAIFGIQVALAALLKSWGIEPDGVVGHSIGELAALHVSGALSLADAVHVVWHRAQAMQRASGRGAMAAVSLSESEASALVARFDGRLSVGAVNGPRSAVLSGDTDALDAALAEIESRGLGKRAVPVRYAFHSAQMAPHAAALVGAVGAVRPATPRCAVYSTVTGARLEAKAIDPGYFGRNVSQPVRFADAIGTMLEDGFVTFVEIAAHPVLAASIAECVEQRGVEATAVPTIRRARPERSALLQTVASIYAGNREPAWESIDGGPATMVDLPAYAWQHERYWLRDRPTALHRTRDASISGRGILGVRHCAPTALAFDAAWPDCAPAWLEDHRVAGRVVVPGMAMLEALHAAASDRLEGRELTLRDFVVHRPLVLGEPGESPVRWQVAATSGTDGPLQVSLHERRGSDASPEWLMVASAQATTHDVGPLEPAPPDLEVECPATATLDRVALYSAFDSLGVRFGGHFRTLRGLRVSGATLDAWLERTGERQPSDGGSTAWPSGSDADLLDGVLQACVAGLSGRDGMPAELLLPVAVERLRGLRSLPPKLRMRAEVARGGGGSMIASIAMWDVAGMPLGALDDVRFAPADGAALSQLQRSDPWMHEVAWQLESPPTDPRTGLARDAWIVLADVAGFGQAVARVLEGRGCVCRVVHCAAGVPPVSVSDERLDPADPSAFERLLADDAWRRGRRLAGILHSWSLDVARSDATASTSPGSLEHADSLGPISGLHLVKALIADGRFAATRLAIVTSGAQPAGGLVVRPQAAALWGLLAAARAERPDLDIRALDLDPDAPGTDVDALVCDLLGDARGSRRVAYRAGKRFIPVLQRMREPEPVDDARRLRPDGSGTLDGLKWQRSTIPVPASDQVTVRVEAAGVNFRDVLVALGMYPGSDTTLGAECAGVVEAVGSDVHDLAAGDVVFGFARNSLATRVAVPAAFLAPVPADVLSAERAAALPAAYLTALYGLSRVARLRAGQRILIHAAAGGVGMAAVQVAQRAGATVFATAGSARKRDLVKALGVAHVLDSRSTSFAEEIRELTNGAGVEVVLNSLAGEFIDASLQVLAKGGCFLELGKRGILSVEAFEAHRPDARYHPYDFGEIANAEPALVRELLGELVQSLRSGSLRSLPTRVFDWQDAGAAFRFMAQAQHVGKLVLHMPPPRDAVASHVRPDATYLITGGLGSLGIRTAKWLSHCGARNVVLVGRRPPSAAVLATIRQLEGDGTRVVVRNADVGDPAALREILSAVSREMPPLRGVVHAAGVLEDATLPQQDAARFSRALRGKAHGALHLHELTKNSGLDFFVLYSAAGLVLGPAGQAAYAAANAELDALAHARRAAGLPATSVAWGMWSEGGMAAALTDERKSAWAARGLGWMDDSEGFSRLSRALSTGAVHTVILPIDWARFHASGAASTDPGFYSRLAPRAARKPDGEDDRSSRGGSIVPRWQALPESQRRDAVMGHALESALQVLGLPASTSIDARVALKDVGLDSLMAVELRNALSRTTGQSLPATLMFDYPTLEALVTFLMRHLALESVPVADASEAGATVGRPRMDRSSRPDEVEVVAALSDEEAEAQLLAELEGRDGQGKK